MNPIVGRDPGDETTWPHHTASPETGLCERPYCDDVALPGEEFCRECLRDIFTMELDLFEEDAYDIRDPKHPRHHEVFSD